MFAHLTNCEISPVMRTVDEPNGVACHSVCFQFFEQSLNFQIVIVQRSMLMDCVLEKSVLTEFLCCVHVVQNNCGISACWIK